MGDRKSMGGDMLQFQQLAVFVEVAKSKSFSKAAQDLYLSQSTVSTHISNLETYFEKPLFDRLGRQVVLTPFGKKMYYWATEIINLKAKALDDLYNSDSLRGSLDISASTVPAQFIVPELLKSFMTVFPKTNFIVHQSDSQSAARKLLDGSCDLAFTGEKHFEADINYIPIMKDGFLLITPKNIELKEPVTLNTLLRLDLIYRTSGSGTQSGIERVFKENNLNISSCNIIGYFDSVQAIFQSVKSGLGCSIISKLAYENAQKDAVNSYEIQEFSQYHRWFYLAVHKKRTLSKLSALFVSRVQSSIDG